MSLKLRLMASIAASLLLTLLVGGAALFWQARSAAQNEIAASFRVTEHAVRITLQGDVQHKVTFRQVIGSIDGHRNLRAYLYNEKNQVIAASTLGQAAVPAPAWFTRMIAPEPMAVRIPLPLPGFPCTLLLKSDPTNQAAQIWQFARAAFAAMLLFCATALVSVWLIVGHALRFFGRFQSGLRNIAERDYEARLAPEGGPDFAPLAEGFNHMAERLAASRNTNRRLQEQILSLQDEERAEIARDLHDEVGPYLFAIQVDADRLAKSGNEQARERAGSIREAALHIQSHVKNILRQLRPVSGLDFGLETAIDDLIAFWKRRHPEIRFERQIAFGVGLDRRGEETAYRIVQESISNALRHGHPRSIRVQLAEHGDGVSLSIEDDGKGFVATEHAGGMGLKGMAERVHALNGQFMLEHLAPGVRVRAILPRAAARPKRELEEA
jgi:two-component system, NarL family, sensor histidine kinase UhpB